MKLLPYGRVLPVHCCCEPSKRLGWVPVPRHIAGERITIVAGYDARDLCTGELVRAERIETEVAKLTLGHDDGFETILAVKSADVPLDTWQKVPGFVEDTPARR